MELKISNRTNEQNKGSQNQQGVTQSIALAYDEDGNTTTTELRDGGAAYTATLTWDAENRLVKVEDAATEKGAYGYDHLGRRVFKKVGSETRWFVYDGWNMVSVT